MRWRVIYHDREDYSSEDGGPETAPARGVLVILQDDKDNGVELVHGADYYVWNYERWWRVDINGLWDYLCMPGWKAVLFGRMVLQEEYDAAIRAAGVVKETWFRRERRTT
jgi:hypothetical protein